MMKIRCRAFFDVFEKQLIENAVIVVENGKICGIGTAKGFSAKEEDLNFPNKFILPGFVDAHNHLCFDVGDEVEQIGESLAYQALVGAKNARIAINSGVTLQRDAGEKGYTDFALKRAIMEGKIPGPRLYVAGPSLMRTGGHMWYMGEEVDGEDEVRKGVRRQLRSGVDFIKLFVSGGATSQHTGTLTPEMTKREIEVVIEEAHAAGKRVGAHTHGGIAATWAIEAGVDAVEHGCFFTEVQLNAMRDRGTYLVSTSGIQRAIRDFESNSSFMRSKAGVAYANYHNIIGKAIAMGLRIAIGNDTNHGCIAEEIEFLVKSGASVEDAICSATIVGTTLCERESITGSIEVGKEADLIVFDENPLEKIEVLRNPCWVFRAGNIMKSPR